MSTISEKFIKGLKEYKLTLEMIKPWKYCGGNRDSKLKYYTLVFPGRPLPISKDICVCGHKIVENCYITDDIKNGDRILILGNCCIKRFIPNSKRSCEVCNKPHRNRIVNRIVNRCNDCRIGVCDKCRSKCSPPYKLWYNCSKNNCYQLYYMCYERSIPNLCYCLEIEYKLLCKNSIHQNQ